MSGRERRSLASCCRVLLVLFVLDGSALMAQRNGGRTLTNAVLDCLTTTWQSVADLSKLVYKHRHNKEGSFQNEVQRQGGLTQFLRGLKALGVQVDEMPNISNKQYRARLSDAGQRRRDQSASPRASSSSSSQPAALAVSPRREWAASCQPPAVAARAPPVPPPAAAVPQRAPAAVPPGAPTLRPPAAATQQAMDLRQLGLRLEPMEDEIQVPWRAHEADTNQESYLDALNNPRIRLVACTGIAGTGKTVLAAIGALRWQDQSLKFPPKNHADFPLKVVLMRPSQDALTLDQLAKPMTDAIKAWVQPKARRDQFLKDTDRIEAIKLDSQIRGVELRNSFVLVDEVIIAPCSIESSALLCFPTPHMICRAPALMLRCLSRVAASLLPPLCSHSCSVSHPGSKCDVSTTKTPLYPDRDNKQGRHHV